MTEADVVEPVAGEASPIEQARELRRIALQLVKDAEGQEADGEPGRAEELREGATELREQAVALDPEFETAGRGEG